MIIPTHHRGSYKYEHPPDPAAHNKMKMSESKNTQNLIIIWSHWSNSKNTRRLPPNEQEANAAIFVYLFTYLSKAKATWLMQTKIENKLKVWAVSCIENLFPSIGSVYPKQRIDLFLPSLINFQVSSLSTQPKKSRECYKERDGKVTRMHKETASFLFHLIIKGNWKRGETKRNMKQYIQKERKKKN